MEVEHLKIFYSWQSKNPKFNRYFIQDAIKKAIRKLHSELKIEIILDSSTANSPGSPNIVDEILRGIRSSDIFICDTSLINNNWKSRLLKERLCPNPNVLIELGYAARTLGWKRIICIFNNSSGQIEDLPFDIKQNRITVYHLNKKEHIKSKRDDLTNTIYRALKKIINDYDEICREFNSDENLNHEQLIFKNIQRILDEKTLLESLERIRDALDISKHHLKRWDELIRFNELIGNKFISSQLNGAFENYIGAIHELRIFVSVNFHLNEDIARQLFSVKSELENSGVSSEDVKKEIDKQTLYQVTHSPIYSNHEDFYIRKQQIVSNLYTLTDNVKSNWGEFRSIVKEKLRE